MVSTPNFPQLRHALAFVDKAPNLYTNVKLRHRSFTDKQDEDDLKYIVDDIALVTQNEIFRNFKKSEIFYKILQIVITFETDHVLPYFLSKR